MKRREFYRLMWQRLPVSTFCVHFALVGLIAVVVVYLLAGGWQAAVCFFVCLGLLCIFAKIAEGVESGDPD